MQRSRRISQFGHFQEWTQLLKITQPPKSTTSPKSSNSSSSPRQDLLPSQPRYWNFSLEISERQYRHLARLSDSGDGQVWRGMVASSPPFTHFWYSRTFYELGSGRAPFVQWWDYDGAKMKGAQRFVWSREDGVRVGDLVDAVRGLFERFGSGTRFVLCESVRAPDESGGGEVGGSALSGDRPGERGYVLGRASSERVGGWYD